MSDWHKTRAATREVKDHAALTTAQLACAPDVIIEAANGGAEWAKPLPTVATGEPHAQGARRLAEDRRTAPPARPTIKVRAPCLREGGILAARASDPGWTPLFLLAQAVVVEIRFYLSHGAIVARAFDNSLSDQYSQRRRQHYAGRRDLR